MGAGGLEPPYPHAAHGASQSTPLPQFSAIDEEEEEEKEEETPQKKKILKKKGGGCNRALQRSDWPNESI